MKFLLTGATSFVGKHVAKAFEDNGDEVFLLLRKKTNANFPEFSSIQKTYLISEKPSTEELILAFQSISPECVIHIAGKNYDENDFSGRNQTIEANFLFGWNLLNAALQSKTPYFLNTGSYWSFGDENNHRQKTLYAIMKHQFQRTLEFYASRGLLKSMTLVLYDVYGPSDPRKKVLWHLIQAIKDGSVLEMTQGEQKIDFVHVEDVARGFLIGSHLLPSDQIPSVSQYALRTGVLYDLRTLEEKISLIMKKTSKVIWGAKPYPANQIFNPDQSIPVLPGWIPKNLSEGLRDLFEESPI